MCVVRGVCWGGVGGGGESGVEGVLEGVKVMGVVGG